MSGVGNSSFKDHDPLLFYLYLSIYYCTNVYMAQSMHDLLSFVLAGV